MENIVWGQILAKVSSVTDYERLFQMNFFFQYALVLQRDLSAKINVKLFRHRLQLLQVCKYHPLNLPFRFLRFRNKF